MEEAARKGIQQKHYSAISPKGGGGLGEGKRELKFNGNGGGAPTRTRKEMEKKGWEEQRRKPHFLLWEFGAHQEKEKDLNTRKKEICGWEKGGPSIGTEVVTKKNSGRKIT